MIFVTKTFLPDFADYTKYLEQVWESGHISNRAPLVLELERRLNAYLGTQNLLFVNNGTTALQIAIRALDLKGEIITTPFSYVATTSSIVWENCNPVFVDIENQSFCIDPFLIEEAITENTTAILATHVYGIPCQVEKIEEIAKKHRLKVIYDAAHAFGVTYKGQSLLNYGDVSTLSFHATKLFHTAEGGGIVTKDKHLYDKMFHLHNFGHKGQEDFHGLGINGKNSELHAAMGLAVLPHVDRIISERKRLSELYDSLLVGLPIHRPVVPDCTGYNYAYYPVSFESENKLKMVVEGLKSHDIYPRRYFYPSLNKLNYVEYKPCPVAESIAERILCLPLFAGLSNQDMVRISNVLAKLA